MNFPLYIAKRYLFSKSSNNTINIITIIAALGVIIGTIALFVVLSGFSGLKAFSVGFLQTSDPDFKITATKGKSFEFDSNILNILAATEGIEHLTQVVEERAFFEFKGKTEVAYIKGIEENFIQINNIDTAIVVGRWLDFDGSNQAIVGNGISNKLSMGINDYLQPLTIYVPKPGLGYISSAQSDISSIKVQPIGIFALTEELDRKFVYIPIQLAKRLLGYTPNQVSAIEVKVSNLKDRASIIASVASKLGSDFEIKNREQLNATFYKMLNTENLASYLIFTLILVIALFNVIGALIMMIFDKKSNLKTLYNLGASVKEIRKIFVLQGFLLSFFGLLIGLTIAILLILGQQTYGWFMITPSLAFPVEFKFTNVIVVFITITILGYVAAKIASSRITKKVIE
ncbi:ABC transporter permease [Urechidicola vernalis]|uniref:FtsX-like permease family protein n=1 Tax=Urechidicola vernalis TaxID=3075600 RepID=A0ABU2Y5J6_9FLAO|nr:FtsX-like permease family protein [Urechidicola sp. P050]MDT0553473.1 FtsX-like permease family protein [Urechidicola sp. P050]